MESDLGIEFIDSENSSTVDDRPYKNKWRFEWLDEIDDTGKKYSFWCRKIKEAGLCFCVLCSRKIKYGSNGKKALLKHSKDPLHKKGVQSQQHAVTFPGATPVQAKASSIPDRVAHQKSVVTAFLCENTLPFTLAPKLIELAKNLSSDKSALSKLKMSRTTATYVTTHGTAKCMRRELVQQLKGNFFSLNIDEATNNAMDKILNIMVRFYDDEQKRVVTDHLGSKKENIATAPNLFQKIKDLFTENDLELSQVISCLMDNCNLMRGCKKGVETLIRKENPHLLDIHGDVVHIVHNAAKLFFQNFENFIEGFASDVYYDIQDSPKAKQYFSEIQVLLNFSRSKQILRPIETRFLQMLTVCDRLHILSDAMFVYYYSFLSKEKQNESVAFVNNIYETLKVSSEQRTRINTIQSLLSKQKLTDASKARKERILLPFIHLHEKFTFFLKFYRGILLKFNLFVKMFQSEAPMMHRVHSEMFVLCKEFLSLFIRAEFIPENSVKDLLAVDVKKLDMQLTDKYLSVGKFAFSQAVDLRKKKVNWIPSFYKKLRHAYESTAIYMMKNLPLNNKALIWLSALSPKQRKFSTTLLSFDKLSDSLPQVIKNGDKSSFLEEVRKYSVDPEITELEATGISDTSRIDYDWWSRIMNLKEDDGVTMRYQNLGKLVRALLSVFSSPLVEGTFNIMDDIITDDRSCLTLENYEAASIVKYNLRRKRMKAVDLKPNPKMCNAIHAAHASYTEFLNKKKSPTAPVQSNTKKNALNSIIATENNQGSTSDFDAQINTSISDVQARITNPAAESCSKEKNTLNSVFQPTKKRPASPANIPSKKSKPASAKITSFFKKNE